MAVSSSVRTASSTSWVTAPRSVTTWVLGAGLTGRATRSTRRAADLDVRRRVDDLRGARGGAGPGGALALDDAGVEEDAEVAEAGEGLLEAVGERRQELVEHRARARPAAAGRSPARNSDSTIRRPERSTVPALSRTFWPGVRQPPSPTPTTVAPSPASPAHASAYPSLLLDAGARVLGQGAGLDEGLAGRRRRSRAGSSRRCSRCRRRGWRRRTRSRSACWPRQRQRGGLGLGDRGRGGGRCGRESDERTGGQQRQSASGRCGSCPVLPGGVRAPSSARPRHPSAGGPRGVLTGPTAQRAPRVTPDRVVSGHRGTGREGLRASVGAWTPPTRPRARADRPTRAPTPTRSPRAPSCCPRSRRPAAPTRRPRPRRSWPTPRSAPRTRRAPGHDSTQTPG